MVNEKEKLKQNLENLAKNNGSQQAVSYEKLFNPQFMQKNTKFTTIDFFIKAAGAKSFQNLEDLSIESLNEFIKKETNFSTWEEMQQSAISQYMMSLF
ncbi:hypothetical protein [Lactobacillus agrestimuris]|uniref:hypothetical protein n=1 Tax=Lactobacillus agrestimuris TaxID=2941328 RepID=UPI002042FEF0|nr:hypothetical protein [Lactobacillus agrestimuris]